jgi:hypothetical protein
VVGVGFLTVKGVSAFASCVPSLGILAGNEVKAGLGAPMTLVMSRLEVGMQSLLHRSGRWTP